MEKELTIAKGKTCRADQTSLVAEQKQKISQLETDLAAAKAKTCAPEASWSKNPSRKVQGGTSGQADGMGPGKPLYVSRGPIPSAGTHNGKTWDGYNKCNIGWGGKEHEVADFEYLGY